MLRMSFHDRILAWQNTHGTWLNWPTFLPCWSRRNDLERLFGWFPLGTSSNMNALRCCSCCCAPFEFEISKHCQTDRTADQSEKEQRGVAVSRSKTSSIEEIQLSRWKHWGSRRPRLKTLVCCNWTKTDGSSRLTQSMKDGQRNLSWRSDWLFHYSCSSFGLSISLVSMDASNEISKLCGFRECRPRGQKSS